MNYTINKRNFVLAFIIISLSLLLSQRTYAQVNSLVFSSSTGTFTEISGGTVMTTALTDRFYVNPANLNGDFSISTGPGFDIGFNLTISGETFDRFAICGTGWISLGKSSISPSVNMGNSAFSPLNNSNPISPSYLRTRISALQFSAAYNSPNIQFKVEGSAPNRVLIVQWLNFSQYEGFNDIDAQIKLFETTNVVQIVFGDISDVSYNENMQVGIGGSTASNFNNRTTTTDWANTTAGTLNTATCRFSSLVYPANGLTFSWTAPSGNQQISSSTTQQASTAMTIAGNTNQEIIKLYVLVNGVDNPISAASITFNTNGSTSTSDISAARVYYTTSNIFSTTTQFGSIVINPVGSFNVTGTQQLSYGDNYFWLVYDISSNATRNNIVDAQCTSFQTNETGTPTYIPAVTDPSGNRTIKTPLSGIYTVGTSGNFETLTGSSGLFGEINAYGLNGNVVANIISDISEPATNALNQWTETPTNSNYTLTIQPGTSSLKTLSGSYNNGGLIRLNGADRVTIDGRFSGSGSYFAFENLSPSIANYSVIQFNSLGTNAGATNNTIRNTILKCSNNITGYGIYLAGSLGFGEDNDNNIIIENTIYNVKTGIFARGLNSAKNNNLVISNNTIGSNVVSEYVGLYGIELLECENATVAGNKIFNIISTLSFDVSGIMISSNTTNSIFNANQIYSIHNNAFNHSASGIFQRTGNGVTAGNIISNNVIYDILSRRSTGSLIYTAGIRINSGNNTSIYYNSVNLFGNLTTNAGLATSITAALMIDANVTGVNLRNNSLVNKIYYPSSTNKSYAVYIAGTNPFSTNNYNNYFVSGDDGVLGYLTGNITTLSSWRIATGQDATSISSNPNYKSKSNLVPQSSSLLLSAGTPITGITIDFNGNTRSGSNPNIGAYETSTTSSSPTISYTLLGGQSSTSNRTITGFATISDNEGINTAPGTKPRLYFKKITDNNTFTGNTLSANGWKFVEGSNSSSPFDFTIDYSIINGGSVSVGDEIQYFVVAQDNESTSNVEISSGLFSLQPTSVNLSTSNFPIHGLIHSFRVGNTALSGSYTVGVAAFNMVSGLNLTFEKEVKKVVKKVPIIEEKISTSVLNSNNPKEGESNIASTINIEAPKSMEDNVSITLKEVEVEEEHFIPYLNGVRYDGDLYYKKSDNPELDFPENIEGVYITLTAAIADLNLRGLSGPVTFTLTDNSYTSETIPLTINVTNENVPTSINTLTIKPAAGVTATISGFALGTAVLKIYNDYVIIDGSNSGSTSRNLTITNTSTSALASIWIGSLKYEPTNNVTIKNLNVSTNIQTGNNFAILVSDGTSLTGGYFNNITIENNNLSRARFGIYLKAKSSSGNGNGSLIKNNVMNSSGVNSIYYTGIIIEDIDGAIIEGNEIAEFNASGLNQTGGNYQIGIWIADGSKNVSVERNKIYNLGKVPASSSEAYYSPAGIYVSSNLTNTGVVIKNNILYNIKSRGTNFSSSDLTPMAIFIKFASTGTKIYNNTIFLSDNSIDQASGISAGVFIRTGCFAELKNNIIVNNLGLRTTNGYGAVGVYLDDSPNQLTSSDHNIFYVNPTGSGVKALFKIGGTDYTTLSAWKTASGKDKYSLSGDPGFISSTNLQPDINNPNSWIASSNGTHLNEVTQDFIGTNRPVNFAAGAPDIGAFEFGIPNVDPIVSSLSPNVGNNSLLFKSLNVADINFQNTGTLPSSLGLKFFPGKNPPSTNTGNFMKGYYEILSTDGSGYTYDITINYNENLLGTITSESSIILAKSEDGSNWTTFTTQGTGAGQYQLDTANNKITAYSLNSFSLFTLTDFDNPLPVELTSFTVTLSGNKVELKWKTETEVNNYGFEIERKVGSLQSSVGSFEKIGFVEGNGNSNTPRSYSFIDNLNHNLTHTLSYRLKQIDNDGSFSYSNEIEFEVNIPKEFALHQNYPNPFNPTTKIIWQSPVGSQQTLKVYDILGNEVATLVDEYREAGRYEITFDASNLASGIHFYRLQAGSFVETKKMILLK